jgi:hypothetical protein
MKNLLTEEQESKKFDESLTLTRDIGDETVRSRMQALLSLNFANVADKVELFRLVIDRGADDQPKATSRVGGGPDDARRGQVVAKRYNRRLVRSKPQSKSG